MSLPDIPNPLSNSPLYPMLLMALVAQNYTPVTRNCFKPEYDYIIVGAGSAGSVIGSRLSENPHVNVLLLEAGPSPPPITEVPALQVALRNHYIDWNISTVPQKFLNNRKVFFSLAKTVGGSSVHNTMLNVRGSRRIFDDWAKSGASGWDYRNVLPYFKKLETYTIKEEFNPVYHGDSGPITIEKPSYESLLKDAVRETAKQKGIDTVDPNAEKQTGLYDYTATLRNGRRCSTGKAYLVPAARRRNLHIVANAFVTKIIINNKRAIGVEVGFQGKIYEVKARREVIISAGGVHTPQLLMLSGIGPKEELDRLKIPVEADLPVGQNFHDHPTVSSLYKISSKIMPFVQEINLPSNINRYISDGKGPLSAPKGLMYNIFVSNKNNCKSKDDVPYNQMFFINGNMFDRKYDNKSVMECYAAILNPKSRGRITLNSSNPYDPPLVDPNYYDDKQDLKTAISGLQFCDDFISSDKMQKLVIKREDNPNCMKHMPNGDGYYKCHIKDTSATIFHPVGTARMGRVEDPTTVVDPLLRVKGLRCLRVVDASVMPIITSGNTNIPTIMIAEKAVDLIRNSRHCRG